LHAEIQCADSRRSIQLGLNRYTFTVSARLPLNPKLRTYRCVAISDVTGQERNNAANPFGSTS